MSNNPSSFSSSNTSHSSLESTTFNNKKSLKQRFSAHRMLSKAKESTKSLVNDVLEKRHSLDSKRDESLARQTSVSSRSSFDKLKSNIDTDSIDSELLSTKQKHYSLPIRRPFTIKKSNANSVDSFSSASLSINNTNTTTITDETTNNSADQNDAAAMAEADILSGIERPGSFATACDLRLASEKRNEEFHVLFKSVQQEDILIEDYKCALHKEILLQGHLYISEHHVCFKSNIFGWVTNLVINFGEITRVEKRMTAKIIPNGIIIATNTSVHVFASFLLRDQAYDQIVKIWDLSKRRASLVQSQERHSVSSSLYEEDEDEDMTEADSDSIPSTDSAIILHSPPLILTDEADETKQDTNIVRPKTPVLVTEIIPDAADTAEKITIANNSGLSNNNALAVFNKQQLRPRAVSDSYREKLKFLASMEHPTSELSSKREIRSIMADTTDITPPPPTPIKKTHVCPCTVKGEQYHHVALNETYSGTVQSIFRLLFDSLFIKEFLERYENFEQVDIGKWKHGTRQVIGKRKIKSTCAQKKVVKTLFQEKRIHRKFPYFCCVTANKSMPDLPMGTVYSIQSRTCITRVNQDKVHVLVTFEVTFSKSGLVSSIIEKNAADDQYRLFTRLHSILTKPELIRKLIPNEEDILTGLNIDPTSSNTKPANGKNTVNSRGIISNNTFRFKVSHFIYLGFALVIFTHVILAVRLQRITENLQVVQDKSGTFVQLKSSKTGNEVGDSQWMQQKMHIVHQRLNELKDEVIDYDERISKMKNMHQ